MDARCIFLRHLESFCLKGGRVVILAGKSGGPPFFLTSVDWITLTLVKIEYIPLIYTYVD
jgi:hypothetical protein